MLITSAKIALISFISGSASVIGYKYYEDWKNKKDYENLYGTFLEYELENYITEYSDNRPRDKYEPFRVVNIEEINQVCFSV